MKRAEKVVAIGAAVVCLVAMTACDNRRAGGVPWRVIAPKGMRWTLACDFAWVRRKNAYNPRDYVNQFERTGSGSMSGRLLGGDGRCALTTIQGGGSAKLVLMKDGVEHSQVTELGHAPAQVVVY